MKNTGIEAIYEMIEEYLTFTKDNDFFNTKRNEQNKFWLLSTIEQNLRDSFFKNSEITVALTQEIDNITKGISTPFASAKKLLNLYDQRS